MTGALVWAGLGGVAGFILGRRLRAVEIERAFWHGVRDTREAVSGGEGGPTTGVDL